MDRHIAGRLGKIKSDMNNLFRYISMVSGILLLQCACGHSAPYSKEDNTLIKPDKPDISDNRYSKTLSDNIVYANALSLVNGSVALQCFDILKNGDIMASGIRNSALYFQRMTPDGKCQKEMKIWYAAHGTNMSAEEEGEDIYLWTSNHASNLGGGEGDYYAEKIISRVKYEPGKELMPEDCNDNYYVGPYQNLLVCLDSENDNLCILYSSDEKDGKDTRVDVWSLAKAKKVPLSTVNIGAVVRGGKSGPVKEKETIYPDVTVHDLRTLKPKYSFFINSSELNAGDPMQGFCIYGKRFYWFTGDGGKRTARISVITFGGIEERMHQSLRFIENKDDIVSLGSQSGYFEAEGIKIHKGTLYTGYLWGPSGHWKLTIMNH